MSTITEQQVDSEETSIDQETPQKSIEENEVILPIKQKTTKTSYFNYGINYGSDATNYEGPELTRSN